MNRKRITHSLLGPVTFACLITLLSSASQSAGQQQLPTHHVRNAVTKGQATLLKQLPDTQKIALSFVLTPRNASELKSRVQEISDPNSSLYRQFLSVQEFTEKYAPTQETYDAVSSYLASNGITVKRTYSNRMVIDAEAPVKAINQTFNVSMGTYSYPTENRSFYAIDREPTADQSVPLWHIGGLDNFSIPKPFYKKASTASYKSASGNTTGSGPSGSFLGSDRRAAYYGATTLTGSGQAVALFELDGYSISDVDNYFTNVGQTLSVPINKVLLLDASGSSDGDDTEQVIDIIEAVSMAPALSQVLVYIAPESTFSSGTSDTDIFNRMATDNIAKQISVSWGWTPDDPTDNDPIFEEMAAQGQTIFVASGDYNAYAYSDYAYAYPAEDIYVTSVGGTILTTNGAGGSWLSETAWGDTETSCDSGTGSGGGPSPDDIGIPNYQTISGVITSSNGGSSEYRNIPDLAAQADCSNYYCANGSCGEGLGGTSLAAPTWAGFLALVNQEATTNSKAQVGVSAQMGFLNPPIYDQIATSSTYSDDLHDITSGSNVDYFAVTGYDLVTGWGSPAGATLISDLAIGGQCGYLGPGHFLASGKTITSCDGRFTLKMQSSDGNLVLYWGSTALWSANTTGHAGAYATMQDDGNLVVYSSSGTALWSANSTGSLGAYLEVQDDGNMVVYNPGRTAVWNTDTCCH